MKKIYVWSFGGVKKITQYNLNSAIIIKEIEFICLKLQKKLSQIHPDGFTAKFYQIFEELIPIIHKLLPEKKNSLQKIEEEEILFIHFMRPVLA